MSKLYPPMLGVGVLVWDPRGRLLLGQRKNSHSAGEWWLPGGKPEYREHPRDAAIRELHEETSIRVSRADMLPLEFWTFDTNPAEDVYNVTVFYQCKLPHGEQARLIEPDKCAGWRWVDDIEALQPHYDRLSDVVCSA